LVFGTDRLRDFARDFAQITNDEPWIAHSAASRRLSASTRDSTGIQGATAIGRTSAAAIACVCATTRIMTAAARGGNRVFAATSDERKQRGEEEAGAHHQS